MVACTTKIRRKKDRYKAKTRPRKTVRQNWFTEDMERAIKAVKEGSMGYLKASKEFAVPKSTLERRVKGTNKIATGSVKVLGNMTSVLPSFIEDLLVKHILEMEAALFGLTLNDVRLLAFELAELNNVPHKFNWQNKMAGKS